MKLSDLSAAEWATRLERRRLEQQTTLRHRWEYYNGEQPLYYVAKILAEQNDRFPALVVNWCEKFVDMIDRRCTVEGFRVRGDDQADDMLWGIWQRNNLDELQSENNIAALVTGVSYGMAAPSATGEALLTIESPESVTVEFDHRTGQVIAAWKVWKSDPEQAIDDLAELWLPGQRIDFEYSSPVDSQQLKWVDSDPNDQLSTVVPVFPFQNRRRRWRGNTEMGALIPLVDACNQTATNMMAGVEHHAVPRKYALGVNEKDFVDESGNPIPAWKIATGALWVSPFDEDNPDAEPEVGQFAASDLRNFHETLNTLARLGAGLCDVSPHAFGFGVSDNPPSADSIRASQDDFIGRIERIHTGRGGAYERMMALAAAIEGQDPTALVRLETVWRNPATPTQVAKSQAAVANYDAGLSDLRQAREDAGYTKTQIDDMEARERTRVSDPALGDAIDALNAERDRARQLVDGSARGA